MNPHIDIGTNPDRPESEATYNSKCPGCGGMIHEGDTIVKVDDEWVCEDCKTEED